MLSSSLYRCALALGLVLVGCGSPSNAPNHAPGASAPEVKPVASSSLRVSAVKEPRAFSTAAGVRIEIVPLEPIADSATRAPLLIRMTGVRDELDGVVMLARENEKGYISVTIRGEPRMLVYNEKRSNKRSGWYYRAQTDGYGGAPLDVADATTIDPESLMQRYQRQAESGLNERLSPSDRATREKEQMASLQGDLASEEYQSCGPLRIAVDWSTVADHWFDEFGIASACSADLRFINDFCTRFPNRIPEIRALSDMTCVFDGMPDSNVETMPRRGKGGLILAPQIYYSTERPVIAHLRALFGETQQVLRGKNVTFIARDEGGTRQMLYSGKGNTFYPIGELSDNTGVTRRDVNIGAKHVAVKRDGGTWSLECEEEVEPLEFLEGAARDSVLKSAKFESKPLWRREPYFLGRDTRGTYYYVDRFSEEFGGKRYRVFTGRRGQMKVSKLKAVVEDTEGTLFSTEAGDLRLVVHRPDSKATWIRGRRKSDLTPVNVVSNAPLIYDELGAYFGENLGSPCGD